MMTKSDAIRILNLQFGSTRLNRENTHWANVISYGSKEGWWLNVPFHKFAQELHLILNSDEQHQFTHIAVPPGAIAAPNSKFRSKDDSADIFMPCAGRDRLVDVQSGSSRHDFSIYKPVDHKYK